MNLTFANCCLQENKEAIQPTNPMFDVDLILFSFLDLKQDQVTQYFQFDPPVTVTPST